MNNYPITTAQIHEATNNGLDIYIKYLPHLPKGAENGKKGFKYRLSEKSESSYLYKSPDGIVFLKDFGGKSYSPVSFVCDNFGLSYGDAIAKIAADFNIGKTVNFYKPVVVFKTATTPAGSFTVNVKPKVVNAGVIGKYVDRVKFSEYNFYEVESYEKVFINKKTNQPTSLTVTATENYPIFAYSDNLTVWAKIYEPKAVKDNKNKSNKHSYLGTKPTRFVHGLQRLLDLVDVDYIAELRKNIKNADSDAVKTELKKMLDDLLIPEIYICTGGSDGLAVASMGKHCVWLNSESEKLDYTEYKLLRSICKRLINIPDIDTPGKLHGKAYAMLYWNMETIWLCPKKMFAKGKDVRDFFDFYNKLPYETLAQKFDSLKNTALKCNFIDTSVGVKNKIINKINLSNLHYFLSCNNIYTYVQERKHVELTSKEEIVFVQISDNNIVDIISPQIIRHFCELFLKEKGCTLDVLNVIKASNYFGFDKLEGLNRIELNTKNSTKTSQLFVFKNKTVQVTATDIEVLKEAPNCHTFNKTIVKHDYIKTDDLFSFYKDTDGNNRVTILNQNCEALNFLINTSRVFWRDELEKPYTTNSPEKLAYFKQNQFTLNGKNLELKNQIIQEQHLLNKLYILGYMLHRYKRSDYAKMVYLMDDAIKDNYEDANGRSGKSLFVKMICQVFKNYFEIDGKNKTITTDKHIFHGFDENNEMVLIEDADMYLDLKFFYTKITSSIVVNPKNSKPYKVDFQDAAKMIWTTNYGKPNLTGSDIGRLLFGSFSDYYHEKTDNYHEKRSPSTDFGHQMFDDWCASQTNLFYNLMTQAVRFYLQHPTTEFAPPMDNIRLTNLKASIGDNLLSWINDYFLDKIDTFVIKKDAFEDYKKNNPKMPKNMANFKHGLKLYCQLITLQNEIDKKPCTWNFNPPELINTKDGRLMKWLDNKTQECLYIQTKPITPEQKEDTKLELPF